MTDQIISKRCSTCKQIKPVTEFYKNKSDTTGYHNQCKNCANKWHQSEKGRKSHRKARSKYKKSPKGRVAEASFRKSQKSKNIKRKYEKSEKNKHRRKKQRKLDWYIKAQRKYIQSQKGKNNIKRYRKRHPDKVVAWGIVGYAIKIGQIPKAAEFNCDCGKQAQLYHHHNGYEPEHWLEVTPVCYKCHNSIHSNNLTNDRRRAPCQLLNLQNQTARSKCP